ncbi:MAG: 5'-deoxynucleotidase [Firmicutes bacterium]|nr:5'-deoxynucleotidase [Bacillota bacterium]
MNKFFAFLNRLKLIRRWGLMRNRHDETVAQHSHQTAVLAHSLGLIDREIFGLDTDADKCAVYGLYHEVSEVLVGDMPTPVKYRSEKMRAAFLEAEKQAEERMLQELPTELKKEFAAVVRPTKSREALLVKYADKIAAYIKCVEETSAGNTEFIPAQKSTLTAIEDFKDKTVDYFMKNFADSFALSLDELISE